MAGALYKKRGGEPYLKFHSRFHPLGKWEEGHFLFEEPRGLQLLRRGYVHIPSDLQLAHFF